MIPRKELEGWCRKIVRAERRIRPWIRETSVDFSMPLSAAGVALAGFLRCRRDYEGKNVAVVICGRNISAHKEAKLVKMGS